jgi:pyrroline-5-carboxylate reductase
MTIVFIGGGNMASALVGGLVGRGVPATDFVVIEPVAAQRDALLRRFSGMRCLETLAPGTVAGAQLLVLAVKPQQLRSACAALAPMVEGLPAVLSIAAGVRCADLSRWLGGYARLVRAMPNTPALIGQGVSGVYAMPGVDVAGRAAAVAVLEAAGQVLWCPREEALDAVTGVSGSGPAYVFYFLEGLVEAAMELGFGESDARTLAYATFSGSMALAQRSEVEPAKLRDQVTSKGGTTERAIAVLEGAGVKQQFIDAVKAAAARAHELGDAAGRD